MGIGTSLSLFAIGAILRYAVTATVQGIALPTVGLILMIVGIVGLVISLAYMFAPRRRDEQVIVDRPPVAEQRRYVP